MNISIVACETEFSPFSDMAVNYRYGTGEPLSTHPPQFNAITMIMSSIPSGQVNVPINGNDRLNEKVTLMFRPEDAQIIEHTGDYHLCTDPGKIDFLGGRIRILGETDGGDPIIIYQQNEFSYRQDKMFIQINTDKVHLGMNR